MFCWGYASSNVRKYKLELSSAKLSSLSWGWVELRLSWGWVGVKIELKMSFRLASLVILIRLVYWVSVPNFSSLAGLEVQEKFMFGWVGEVVGPSGYYV